MQPDAGLRARRCLPSAPCSLKHLFLALASLVCGFTPRVSRAYPIGIASTYTDTRQQYDFDHDATRVGVPVRYRIRDEFIYLGISP